MGNNKRLSHLSFSLLMLLFIGCATISGAEWNQRYGAPVAREFKPKATEKVAYYSAIRPLIEQRCTVCHGCYDAPCQLKLESYQGLLRGASPQKVYDGSRLLGASLTRMFEDAKSTAQWRQKGFHPVLNERNNTAEANINAGLMAQFLELKKQNPLPQTAILPDSFDFNLDKKQYCPSIETFSTFSQSLPLWGMPYALPGLNDREHNLMMSWIRNGAPVGMPPQLPREINQQVTQWEIFFNGDSIKQQLVNRYIFEHIFLANLYFDQAPGIYFRLVRSTTPPGQPLDRISTTRPFDDPGIKRVYYRLWHDPSSIVVKTHMPYALNNARMKKWQTLFYESDYAVTELPGYIPEVAANPFITFAELPVEARYRFMLDEAQFTIMNFIKGPVCRGQVALNVIQNHFWVFFFDPKIQSGERLSNFLKENNDDLHLPAEMGNAFAPLSGWMKYADFQKKYLVAKGKFVKSLIGEESPLELNVIWDGDRGDNGNAALTIFRHNDSASVHQGLIGEPPKTAWIIGYPLLERIHYLLVAGFDVYGNVSHQLLSRIYMDFLRMEGEMNFVEFLPQDAQDKELANWYRGADGALQNYIDLYKNELGTKGRIPYSSSDPKSELLQKLRERVGAAANSSHNLNWAALQPPIAKAFASLGQVRGTAVNYIPQNTIIRIPELGIFTLMHNTAYRNLSSLFHEDKRRIPEEDSLILTQGIVGAYPNAFMFVSVQQIPDFVARIQTLQSETDYQALRDLYGIRRSNPSFWQFSDDLHQWYRKAEPIEAGILDFNRMENR